MTLEAVGSSAVSLTVSGCGNLKPFVCELQQAGFVRKSVRLTPSAQYASIFFFHDSLPYDHALLSDFPKSVLKDIFQNAPVKVKFASDPRDHEGLAAFRSKIAAVTKVML